MLGKTGLSTSYAHLDKFLPRHQSGFRRTDSTAYQLARLVHRVSSGLDSERLSLPASMTYHDQKHLTECGTRAFLQSFTILAFTDRPTHGLKATWQTAASVSESMKQPPLGCLCQLESLKNPSLVPFFFLPTQLTSQGVFLTHPSATNLQTTRPWRQWAKHLLLANNSCKNRSMPPHDGFQTGSWPCWLWTKKKPSPWNSPEGHFQRTFQSTSTIAHSVKSKISDT